jgi:hypothetical protein
MSAAANDLLLTDRAAEAIDSSRRLVVPTDLPGVDCLDVAREAVRRVAAAKDFQVVLYDRSAETWMDHPHPSGPHRADELSDEFDTLAAQLRELEAAGIDAVGWISTVPSLSEIATAVQELDADAVLLPAPSKDRTLVDRLTATGDQNEDVAKSVHINAAPTVVVLEVRDGVVDVVDVDDPDGS